MVQGQQVNMRVWHFKPYDRYTDAQTRDGFFYPTGHYLGKQYA